jgi:hypothetical protein
MVGYAESYKKRATEKNMEEAFQSLGAFVLLHKRLPCPSNLSQKGVAALDCRLAGTFVGILPFKTLGIPEKKAKDAYGRWLTYGVSPCLTYTSIKAINKARDSAFDSQKDCDFFCHVTPEFPSLSVVDEHGVSVISPTHEQEFLALVLVSHGPKGYGAFTDSGNRTPTFSKEKAKNADNSGNFTDQPLCQKAESYFDDTVRWATRHTFIAQYGQTPCLYE